MLHLIQAADATEPPLSEFSVICNYYGVLSNFNEFLIQACFHEVGSGEPVIKVNSIHA